MFLNDSTCSAPGPTPAGSCTRRFCLASSSGFTQRRSCPQTDARVGRRRDASPKARLPRTLRSPLPVMLFFELMKFLETYGAVAVQLQHRKKGGARVG